MLAKAVQSVEQLQNFTNPLESRLKVKKHFFPVLLDPEEAISFIEHIRNDVTKFYPGLLSKMERTLRFAQGQLLTDRINPLLLFGRDARPMARSEKYM